jgi:hypothetical protein
MQRYRRTGIVAIVVGVALAFAVDGFATVGPGLRTYTRNVTAQDLLRAGSGAPRGIWTLRSKAHALSLDAKGQGLVPERASWTTSTVVVSDTPGSISIFCGASVKGTYRWTSTGSRLTFKLVKDPCKDRAGVLAGAWKLSP